MPPSSRFLLLVAAAAYAWVAWAGLTDPMALVRTVGLASADAHATSEIRASYGGQSLALTVLFAAGAWRTSHTRHALVLLAAICGGLSAGRAMDALLAGLPSQFILGLWMFETVMAAGAVLLLRRKGEPV